MSKICFFWWAHKFGKWSVPEERSAILPEDRMATWRIQERTCTKCGYVQVRRI